MSPLQCALIFISLMVIVLSEDPEIGGCLSEKDKALAEVAEVGQKVREKQTKDAIETLGFSKSCAECLAEAVSCAKEPECYATPCPARRRNVSMQALYGYAMVVVCVLNCCFIMDCCVSVFPS